jgi:hypothetical protein
VGQFGGNADPLDGVIDSVRIYNYALSQAQIQTDMNTPIETPPTTARTTTALTCNPNPASAGVAVSFTATVSSSNSGIPSGTLTFTDGTATIGTAHLDSSGVGTYTTSSLAVGQHSITAVYSGDNDNAASNSTVLTEVVTPMPIPGSAQGTYFVDYYSNNRGGADQAIRIINIGVNGTPLTAPVGDICANVYVFDNRQEMISCCACRITPNEYALMLVGTQLTNNTPTGVIPVSGVIMVATTPANGSCNPTAPLTGASTELAQVFVTHLQDTGDRTFVTETQKLPSHLSADEAGFLPTVCSRYFGSSFGMCTCGTT